MFANCARAGGPFHFWYLGGGGPKGRFLPSPMAFGDNNGMELQIDKAGRIVLPKKIRERLRLRPGSALKVEEGPEGLFLRPVERRASLVEKDGLLVHMGQASPGFDWTRAVEEQREERIKDVAGL